MSFGPSGPNPLGPFNRSGDLFHSLFGNKTKGGSVEFDKKGPGVDHHVVWGEGFHFSWDTNPQGNVSGVHGTDHSSGKKY